MLALMSAQITFILFSAVSHGLLSTNSPFPIWCYEAVSFRLGAFGPVFGTWHFPQCIDLVKSGPLILLFTAFGILIFVSNMLIRLPASCCIVI